MRALGSEPVRLTASPPVANRWTLASGRAVMSADSRQTAAAASLIRKPRRFTSNGRHNSPGGGSTPRRPKLARNNGWTEASAATTSTRLASARWMSRAARINACKPPAQAAESVRRAPSPNPNCPASVAERLAMP